MLVADVIASYLQSGSREWHPSSRPQRTYNLFIYYRLRSNKNERVTYGTVLSSLKIDVRS